MSLKFNNGEVEDITYNGTPINEVRFNGTTVWKRQTDPATVAEFTQPGTYTLTVPQDGEYRIIAIGPGGGCALASLRSTSGVLVQYSAVVSSGGSGGYVETIYSLFKGETLTITVGSLGKNKTFIGNNVNEEIYSSSGSESSVKVLNRVGQNLTIARAFGGGGGIIVTRVVQNSRGGVGGSGEAPNGTIQEGNNGVVDYSNTNGNILATATVSFTPTPYESTSIAGRGSGGEAYSSKTQRDFSEINLGTDGYVKIIKL